MTPLVEKGLNAITIGTNLSTGLTYPSDMNRAKEMLVRLHKAGEKLLAEEISAWAKMNGWQTKDADELGALAEQIGKGEKVQIPDGPWWNDNILELLKQNTLMSKKNRPAQDCSSRTNA
ncbi:MAG: hypothetical protein NTU74_13400 [Deltaproteobacteria bacterium]|nr:hypothetical protein [Deltaproteobacteria bacterium]